MLPHFLMPSLLLLIGQNVNGWSPRADHHRISWGSGGSLPLLLRSLNVTDHSGGGGQNTPCCEDSLGSGVCKMMAIRSPTRFTRQCRTSADFSFIQCCASCHFANGAQLKSSNSRLLLKRESSLYDRDVHQLLQSGACSDRKSRVFCEGLVTQNHLSKPNSRMTDIYKRLPIGYDEHIMSAIDRGGDAPCDSSALAFRVCRKTCGYCSKFRGKAVIKFDADVARNPRLCKTIY
ncbi:hypothetical protein PRIPAC_96932 [Pristionchus pacificus]|uniref:Uncharacterized protein n=1 Tax=Pristionchus pacificus TaxID=54126 RepID=A0A2A6D1B9_PRIPA|nr:hypothetical protein PRIPAC_96932 [Pristionchus pacificus]|eukprot:PDM84205.1 hypothetical protein PRIPAC_33228 [Pristionchus pacificus]